MTDERRRNIKMVYGSLAYDLDTLARERQLEEAGEMPQRLSLIHISEPTRPY